MLRFDELLWRPASHPVLLTTRFFQGPRFVDLLPWCTYWIGLSVSLIIALIVSALTANLAQNLIAATAIGILVTGPLMSAFGRYLLSQPSLSQEEIVKRALSLILIGFSGITAFMVGMGVYFTAQNIKAACVLSIATLIITPSMLYAVNELFTQTGDLAEESPRAPSPLEGAGAPLLSPSPGYTPNLEAIPASPGMRSRTNTYMQPHSSASRPSA